MKPIPAFASLLGLTLAMTSPAWADPAPMAVPAAPAAAAKFTLDTPIETLVADARAKALLDTDLPGLTTHPRFEMFKGMSLSALAGMAPDKLTPERLEKTRVDLATLN